MLVLKFLKCCPTKNVSQFYSSTPLSSCLVCGYCREWHVTNSTSSPLAQLRFHLAHRHFQSIRILEAFRALSSIAFTSTFATGRNLVRLHGNVWPSFYLTLLTSHQQRCALITSHTMRTRSGRQSTDHGRSLCLTCALGFVCFISS